MKRFLGALWRGWKKFAHVLGVFNTKVILTIMYWVVIALAALVSKIVKPDLLGKRWASTKPLWHPRENEAPSIEVARRQF